VTVFIFYEWCMYRKTFVNYLPVLTEKIVWREVTE